MPTKDEAARSLIKTHFNVEPGLKLVLIIQTPNDDHIRLLEVNANTVPTGSVEPFAFTATKGTPYQTIIAEITPEEWEKLANKQIPLPAGWSLDDAVRLEREQAA